MGPPEARRSRCGALAGNGPADPSGAYFRRMASLPRPLVAALFLLFAGAASAQAPKHGAKVILQKDRIAAAWDTVDCVKNVFKLNPLLFLRGEIPLYYERALSHRLSAELAVGITNRNFIDLSFNGEGADDFSAGTHIVVKPSFHVGARYYLTEDIEPQGFYVQGEFAFLDHAKDISEKDSTGRYTSNTLRDDRAYNDVRLYAGYQRLATTSNWLFDAYIGMGLRNRSLNTVEERLNIADGRWTYPQETIHDNVAAFFLGVKVGYGF